MSLLPSLLGSSGGGGGGGTSYVSQPVICASTVALTVTYANGVAGSGATLTNAGAQAAIALDGVSATLGQRVLIKNQASALQNGIYSVTTVGSNITNWVLTRTTDYDQPAEIIQGGLVPVTSGSTNTATTWMETAAVTTIGVDSITFNSASGTAGALIATNNLSDVANAATSRTNLGLGTMAVQAASAVNITGGSITGINPLGGGAGGTGVNNGTHTLTLGGNLTTVGAFNSSLNMTADTNVTLPTSGTLATTAQLPSPSSRTIVSGTSATMAANTTYILTNTAQTTLTMPAVMAVGDWVAVVNGTNANWIVQLVGSQIINTAAASTTAAGTFTCKSQYDCVTFTCTSANTLFVGSGGYGSYTTT